MKIESSSISMFSTHDLLKKKERKDSLKIWTGSQRPDFEGRKLLDSPPPAIKISIPNRQEHQKSIKAVIETDSDTVAVSGPDRLKILIVEAMIEKLTGRDVKIILPRIPAAAQEPAPLPSKETGTRQPERDGWGIEYDYRESYYEQESMSFEAEGIIKTQDGKEINFTAQFTMSRKFLLENSISIREGDAKRVDPLVINFGGSAAQLTDSKFDFDIDSNGSPDSISFVLPGSGFLALDINGDGEINNGSELFGPSSGNGFAELAKYDDDGNQWIDEKDSVYKNLRIWTKDSTGKDSLFTLSDKNIGAIYLGSISVNFSVKNSANMSHGEVKSAGVYISSNGSAGTLQQIDLTV